MKYHSQHISILPSELLLTQLLDAEAEEDTPDRNVTGSLSLQLEGHLTSLMLDCYTGSQYYLRCLSCTTHYTAGATHCRTVL